MLNERSQLQRPHIVGVYLYEMFTIGKCIERNGLVVGGSGGWGGESWVEMGSDCSYIGSSF